MSYTFSTITTRVGTSPAGRRIAALGEAFARRNAIPPEPPPAREPELRVPVKETPLPSPPRAKAEKRRSRTANSDLAAQLERERVVPKFPPADGALTCARVLQAVAATYGVSVAELRSIVRAKPLVHYRQIAFYLARELAGASFPAIGRAMGGRDHSTAVCAHRAAAEMIAAGNPIAAAVPGIIARLAGGAE